MSWMDAYGLSGLAGIASIGQGNYLNSLPYRGAQQSSFSQEEIRQHIMAMQAQSMQQIQHQQEVPKKPKPKFGSTIKAIKDELQEETDKWLAGVLDA